MTTETNCDLRNLVNTISDLPSFPAVIHQATLISRDPKASAADLASVIETDPSLTAKVLRIANSAFYGLPREVGTVKEAVIVMGFSSVRSLAVAVSAMKMFNGPGSRWLNHRKFWLHSMCCAIVAKRIAKVGRLPEGEAFTAGMLHDIGKIVLDQYAHIEHAAVLAAQYDAKNLLPETERSIIATDHATIGRELAERWNLPSTLCEAIACHHSPDQAASPLLSTITGLADYVCTVKDVKSVVNAGKPPDLTKALSKTGITLKTLAEAYGEFPRLFREAKSLIGTVGNSAFAR